MKNPLRIIKLLMKVRRPSRVDDMTAVFDGFWLRRNYQALTFFGFIVCRTEDMVRRLNEGGQKQEVTAERQDEDGQASAMAVMKNHEMIHLRQAQACHNSWLCFYLLYIWYYLRALPQNRRLKNAAYVLNPFEMEAYEHEKELDYLTDKPKGTNGWRYYAKLTPRERLTLYVQ